MHTSRGLVRALFFSCPYDNIPNLLLFITIFTFPCVFLEHSQSHGLTNVFQFSVLRCLLVSRGPSEKCNPQNLFLLSATGSGFLLLLCCGGLLFTLFIFCDVQTLPWTVSQSVKQTQLPQVDPLAMSHKMGNACILDLPLVGPRGTQYHSPNALEQPHPSARSSTKIHLHHQMCSHHTMRTHTPVLPS